MVVALVVVVALGGGFYVLTRPGNLARVVAGAIARKTGGVVQVGKVAFSLRGPVVLEDVEVRVPGMKAPGDLAFTAKRVHVQYRPWKLLGGKFEATSVALERPVLYLTEELGTGKYNLEYLLEGKNPGKPGKHWPEIYLGAAQAVFGEVENGEYRRLDVVDLNGSLMQDAETAGQYNFTLVHRRADGKEGALLSGNVQPRKRTAWARLERVGPDNPLFAFLPSRVRAWWTRLKPAGQVPPIEFGYDPEGGRGFYATLELKDFELSLPYGGTESRMTGVWGIFELGGERIKVRALRGQIEGIEYIVDGVVNGFAADASYAFRAHVKGAIPEQPRYIFAMPAQVQKQFYRFKPSGKFEAELDLAVAQPGAEPTFSGTVRLAEAKATYAKFPYPLSDLTGEILFDNRQMRFKEMSGRGPTGARVVVDGTITPPADGAAVDVWVRAREVPLDEHLYGAMKSKHKAIYDQFFNRAEYARLVAAGLVKTGGEGAAAQRSEEAFAERAKAARFALGGVIDTEVHILCAAGKNVEYDTVTQVDFRRVSALFEHWPYPLTVRQGRLVIGPDQVEVQGVKLEGLTGAAIGIEGSVVLPDKETGQPLKPELRLTAAGVAVDELLLASIRPQQAQWLREMGLKGKLEGRGRVFADETGEVDFTVDAEIREGSARPHGGAYVVEEVAGPFVVARESVKLTKIQGRHGQSVLTLDGKAQWGAAGNAIALRLMGEEMRFEDPVLDLAPPEQKSLPALRGLFERHQPEGRFGLEVNLQQVGEESLKYDLKIRPAELRIGLRGREVDFQRVSGALVADGERLRLEGVKAEFDGGEMGAEGWLDTEGKAGEVDLTGQASAISETVRAWLPEGITRVIESLALDGPFRLDNAKLRYGQRDEAPTFDFEGDVEWLGARAEIGTPLEDLRGTLHVKATNQSSKENPRLALSLSGGQVRANKRLVQDLRLEADNRYDASQLVIRRLLGTCYGGTVNGEGVVRLSTPHDYAMQLVLQNAAYEPFIEPLADAKWLAARAGPAGEADVVRRRAGATMLSANLTIAGRTEEPWTRRGRGELIIQDAKLFRTPLALALLHVVNLNWPSSTSFDRASASYVLQGDRVRIDRLTFQAPSVEIVGSGSMRYNDWGLDLRLFSRNPAAAQLGPLSGLFNIVKDELLTIYVTGTLQEPQTQVRMLSGVTRSLNRIFGPPRPYEAPPMLGAAAKGGGER